MISTEVLSSIGSHHRRWTSRFFKGLVEDRIEPADLLDGGSQPNIGLLHIKSAYYYSIILITRPFLTESITLHARRALEQTNEAPKPCTTTDTNKILVTACVDSAIRTVDLLEPLLASESLPKRLPFVINALFISALVLGFAYLGDLYQVFRLSRSLGLAQQLLKKFSQDAIAHRNAGIIEYLRDACEKYLELRTARNMECQSLAVGSMFGQLHRLRTQVSTRSQTPSGFRRDPSNSQLHNSDLNNGDQPHTQESSAVSHDTVEFSTTFDLPDDFASMLPPPPPMTPRTLWFDSFDDHVQLFPTISNVTEFYDDPPV